jgi:hypothetical protein
MTSTPAQLCHLEFLPLPPGGGLNQSSRVYPRVTGRSVTATYYSAIPHRGVLVSSSTRVRPKLNHNEPLLVGGRADGAGVSGGRPASYVVFTTRAFNEVLLVVVVGARAGVGIFRSLVVAPGSQRRPRRKSHRPGRLRAPGCRG